MKKFVVSICCALTCMAALSACDDNTSKLTADQQFQLQQQRMAANERERARQHELDMARAENPQPIVQSSKYNRSNYDDGYDYPDVPVASSSYQQQPTNNVGDTGHSTGSVIAGAAIGAAGGYLAGKYASTPKGQKKIEQVKKNSYTGYRFSKSKVSSSYRSFKKRK